MCPNLGFFDLFLKTFCGNMYSDKRFFKLAYIPRRLWISLLRFMIVPFTDHTYFADVYVDFVPSLLTVAL